MLHDRHGVLVFFFFKQKTAYEMRISDWSSDVCSSDLAPPIPSLLDRLERQPADIVQRDGHALGRAAHREADGRELRLAVEDEIGDLHVGIARQDRKSVV